MSYYIADIIGFLAVFFWVWAKVYVSEAYSFWYWLLGAALAMGLGSLLLMTKRVNGWGVVDLLLFVCFTALGVVSFCAGILHLKVV